MSPSTAARASERRANVIRIFILKDIRYIITTVYRMLKIMVCSLRMFIIRV